MDRRITTGRLTTVDDTRRVPVVDLSPTRIYRQPPRRARTPPPRPALIIVDPDPQGDQLAHPRLVRRTRPPTPPPNLPPRRASSPRDRDFEEEPTERRR